MAKYDNKPNMPPLDFDNLTTEPVEPHKMPPLRLEDFRSTPKKSAETRHQQGRDIVLYRLAWRAR